MTFHDNSLLRNYYSFHKIHHEYTTSISPAGLHFHPIEFLFTQSFSNLACMKVALLLGPLNISTFVVWLIFRMWDAYNGHCGYVLVGHLFNFFLLLQMMSFTTFIIRRIVETMALILGFGIVCSIQTKFSETLRENSDKNQR